MPGNGTYHHRREEVECYAVVGSEDGMKRARFDHQGKVYVPEEMIAAIQRWHKIDASAILWIEGPERPSDLTPVALHISDAVFTSSGCERRCIRFFDSPYHEKPKASEQVFTRQKICMRNLDFLMISLVYQLVKALPDAFSTESRLAEDDFCPNDDFPFTAEQDLDLIQRLLPIIEQPSIFVLDGFQIFDDTPKARECLKTLVNLLRDKGTKRVVKVVFTTDGPCEALLGTVANNERFTSRKPVQSGKCPPGYCALPDLR